MAGGVHDVLFRLIGDPDDAERALKEVSAELEAFARIQSEAEAEVNTGDATERLDLLKAKLEELDLSTSEPKITTDIAGILAQIEILQADLDRIDGEDVTVDINMRKDLFDRMQSLTSQTNLLARATSLASSESSTLGSRIANTAVSMGPFTTQLKTAIPVVAALLGVIISLIGAVAAMAASLVEAAAGLGALAIAFGGVLLPAVGLAIGVIKDFKANSDQAGTAANSLKTALQGLAKGWDFAPAIHEVERALADVVRQAQGIGTVISPAFGSFAHAAADAIRAFGNVILKPDVVRSFASVVAQAGGALRPLAQIAGQVFRILTNIANAAMPFLVAGLQGVAGAARNLGNQTSHITVLRVIIANLVGQLQAWLDLIGAVSRIFLGFIQAAAGPGRQFVKFLTDGANALADWVQSAGGQERIKQFFADTLPLAEQLVTMIARLALILIQLGEIAAPFITPIVAGFNQVLSVISAALEEFLKIPAPIRTIIGALVSLALGFGLVSGAARLIPVALGALAGLGAGIFRPLANAAVGAFNAIVGAARRVPQVLRAIWGGLSGAARAAWNAVRAVVVGVLSALVGNVRGRVQAIVGAARAAWSAVRAVTSALWRAALGIVRAVVGTMRSVVSNGFQAILSIARSVLSALRSAVSSAFRAAVAAVRSALGAMRSAASSVFHAVVDTARSVLSAIRGAVSNAFSAAAGAIRSATGALVSAAKAVWEAVKNAVSGVIHINIDIPTPSIPDVVKKVLPGIQHGTRFFQGGLAVVGEKGPEIVNLPRGSQVTPADESARKMGGVTQVFNIDAPPAAVPDPVAAMVKLATLARMRGGL